MRDIVWNPERFMPDSGAIILLTGLSSQLMIFLFLFIHFFSYKKFPYAAILRPMRMAVTWAFTPVRCLLNLESTPTVAESPMLNSAVGFKTSKS